MATGLVQAIHLFHGSSLKPEAHPNRKLFSDTSVPYPFSYDYQTRFEDTFRECISQQQQSSPGFQSQPPAQGRTRCVLREELFLGSVAIRAVELGAKASL